MPAVGQRRKQIIPASAMMGMPGAAAVMNRARSAISGGLGISSNTDDQKTSSGWRRKEPRVIIAGPGAYVRRPMSGMPRWAAETA